MPGLIVMSFRFVLVVGAVLGSVAIAPSPVRAAPATTVVNLNLRDGPGTSFAVLTVMPSGSTVSVDGPPQNGFYPVTYAGTAGWASGDFLSTGGGGAPAPAPSGNNGGSPPSGGNASSAVTTTALNLRAGPSTGDAVLLVMPAGATVTLTGDSANGFAGVSYNGTSGWAFESYLSSGGGGSAPAPSAPSLAPPTGTGGGGTATATTSINLRAGPSTADTVLLVIPAGVTVTLLGETSNGFSSVSYQGVSGWAYSSLLGSAVPPTAEAPPPPTSGGGPTPAAGAGTAYATAAVNLRANASGSAAVITVVPAGATVELTGVAENGFYRVVYQGQLGWIATSYLSLAGPAPAGGGGSGVSQDQIIQIIYDAADRYGQPREDMLRVARCESNLDPNAVNPSGSYGLFQFIRSTWAGTPYASYDIFDAWANANAAGWMWSVGRRSEWVCQ